MNDILYLETNCVYFSIKTYIAAPRRDNSNEKTNHMLYGELTKIYFNDSQISSNTHLIQYIRLKKIEEMEKEEPIAYKVGIVSVVVFSPKAFTNNKIPHFYYLFIRMDILLDF